MYKLPAMPAPPATTNAPVVALVLGLITSSVAVATKAIVPVEVNLYILYPPACVTVGLPVVDDAAEYVSA